MPRHEAEAEAPVADEGFDHREASAGQVGRAEQPATDIFPCLGVPERQLAGCGHLGANTGNLGPLQGRDKVLWSLDPAVRQARGISHADQALPASLQGVGDLAAEAS